MSATWYLVKYMADPRRQEPRNVGLVLECDGVRLTRFAGVRKDGKVDGRRIRGLAVEPEVYEAWIDFYRRKAEEDRWEDVLRLERRGRRADFYSELAGSDTTTTAESADGLLHELFTMLVKEKSSQPGGASLKQTVRALFERAQIDVTERVVVDAQYTPDGRRTKVTFDYGFQNGQLHLMEQLGSRRTVAARLHAARELRSRMEAARLAGSSRSFVVFYSGAHDGADEPGAEDVLLPLEDQATTVDVDDEAVATESVRALLQH